MKTLEKLFRRAGEPPKGKPSPAILTQFGDERIDEYYWLRERGSPEVIDLLARENLYTQHVMEPLKSLEESLYNEIKSRIKETDLTVPTKKKNFFYYSKTQESLQYPIHVRRRIDSQDEQIVLDQNVEAEVHEFYALGGLDISPSEDLMAYLSDHNGSELYTLRIRRISKPTEILAEVQDCYYGTAWSKDSRYVFYVKTDPQMRPYQIWRLSLDTLGSELVLQEDDETFYVSVGTTKDDLFILIEAESKTSSQSFLIDASEPLSPPKAFSGRVKNLEYSIEHARGRFFIVTNRDNPDFTLMTIEEGISDHTRWRPFIEPTPGVRLLGIEAFVGHLAMLERYRASTRLRIIDTETLEIFEVQKKEETSTIYVGANEDFDSEVLRFEYSSMITPRSVFDIDLRTHEVTLLKQSEVLGSFDPNDYQTFRVWADARDGTPIPISIVCRSDLVSGEGGHPTLIYGYGSYEHSIDPTFSSARLSLIDRGLIFAIAHVRGGGEMGRDWYLNGKFTKKMNTFTDFVDCTQALVDLGWADRTRIAARGGSAGGMLMGAAINLEPDLYSAIVAEVPFVDCLTTILDASLPLTTFEWEEWGNPLASEEIYSLMKQYTPYENISSSRYPAILVTAGLNDPRVSFWEPAKWVQRLRQKTLDPRILLKTEMGAGHQGPSGRYDAWRDEAFVFSFILSALGKEEIPII